MPRKPKPKKPTILGLSVRGERAYYQRELPSIGRVYRSLDCGVADPVAQVRAGALNTLAERGDLGVIARWRDTGEPHITEIVRAVREGDWSGLKKLNAVGPRLGEASAVYMEQTAKTLQDKTYRQYRSTIDALLRHFGADAPMATIGTAEAQAFLWAPKATVKDGGVWAPATQREAKTTIGALWSMVMDREADAAQQHGVVPSINVNPWKKAKTKRVASTRHAYLLREEWAVLIAHPQVVDTPVAALLGCATLAGLRRAELIHLRTNIDVDMDAGLLRIQQRGGTFKWLPKGVSKGEKASVRDVPIVGALRRLLERHVELGYAGARYFFRSPGTDCPMADSTPSAWAEKALKAAGLTWGRDDEDSFTLHSLRHTYATHLVSRNVPIPTVAKYMGNTPAVTLSTYAHHVPSDDGRVVDVIEAFATGRAA